VLEQAVRMAAELGVEAVTMRALADSLGVSAMSLYAHVTDKDDILDAVIEARLRSAGVPDVGLPWQQWIVSISQNLRTLLVAEPALLDRYSRRPVGVPAALARMDAALDVLARAGFDGAAAVTAFAAVHTYTIGFAALEAARGAPTGRARRSPASLADTHVGYWPAYFAATEVGAYPQLRRLRPDLVAFTADAQFDAGLAALIDGLDHRYLRGRTAADGYMGAPR
jgi:AcrR family transcriptional regulator